MLPLCYNKSGSIAEINCHEYAMKYNKCVICESPRSSSSPVCSSCMPLYSAYLSEPWFLELARLQRKQFQIDRLESAHYTDQYNQHSLSNQYGSKRKRGRPRRSETIEAYVRSVYHSGLSIRQLTRLCYIHGFSISRETVRAIINKIKTDN